MTILGGTFELQAGVRLEAGLLRGDRGRVMAFKRPLVSMGTANSKPPSNSCGNGTVCGRRSRKVLIFEKGVGSLPGYLHPGCRESSKIH